MKKYVAITLLIILFCTMSFATAMAAEVDLPIVSISAGVTNSFFVKSDGSLWAVGENTDGQLGDGTNQSKNSVVKIMDNVSSVSAGGKHTLILKTDGSLWTVGKNNVGQLGTGDTVDSITPIHIMNDVMAIDAGYSYSAAIKTNGTLWVWGYNNKGLVSEDQPAAILSPIQIDTDCKDVACGTYSMLIVKRDGTLLQRFNISDEVAHEVAGIADGREHYAYIANSELCAWGLNNAGQLGDGTNDSSDTIIKIATDVEKVAAGYSHTLFIKTDGTLWATGFNEYGQIGDGTVENKNIPVQVLSDARDVSASGYHNLAIKRDGTVWGWGDNRNAQLTQYNKSIVAVPTLISIDLLGGSPSDWAVEEVAQAAKLSLITPALSGNYQKDITREEFAELIVTLIQTATGETIAAQEMPFTDTSNPNVAKAYTLGIILGTSDTTFSPYLSITREEISVMFYRMVKAINPEIIYGIAGQFADDALISDWAKDGVYFAYANGIVLGVENNNFDPLGKCTAEQSLLMVLRTYNLLTE